MPRSPTPSNTLSVWVDALWAWPTLTRCPTQASGISFSDIVFDIAASLRDRQLRLQHSEVFAPQHVREIEREVKSLASRQALILTSRRQSATAWSAVPQRVACHRARSSTDPPFALDAAFSLR